MGEGRGFGSLCLLLSCVVCAWSGDIACFTMGVEPLSVT